MKEFIEALRQRLVLSEVLSEWVSLKRKGGHFIGLCPFHQEKTPSFFVSNTKGTYYCFGCGAKGDLFEFVMQKKGLNFMETLTLLGAKIGMVPPKRVPSPEDKDKQRARPILERAAQWYREQFLRHEKVQAYCAIRGFSPENCAAFHLGFAPETSESLWTLFFKDGIKKEDLIAAGLLGVSPETGEIYERFRHRIMIPIYDPAKRLVAFGARALGDGLPKYLNSPETKLFKKGEILFGWPQAEKTARPQNQVVIVEGYLDVMALHAQGMKNVVASMGTALTPLQLAQAWKLADTPLICFDGDEAGQRAAARVLENVFPLLKPGKSLDFLFLPPGEDPDSFVRQYGLQAFGSLCHKKMPLVEFLWQRECGRTPVDTPEQKAALQTRFRQILASIGDKDVRVAYEQDIRERLFALRYKGKLRKSSGAEPQEKFTPPLAPRVPLLQQKMILALALEYPALVEADLEIFAMLTMTDANLRTVQQDICTYIYAQGPLEKASLLSYIEEMGHKALAESIFQAVQQGHARFMKKDAPIERVQQGWHELLQKERNDDIHDMQKQLRHEMTQETWQRMKAILSLQREE